MLLNNLKTVYPLVLHEVGNSPVVTWKEKHSSDDDYFVTRLNLLERYRKHKWQGRDTQFSMPAAFYDGKGPYVVRAAQFFNEAVALIFTHVTDRKVGYELITEKDSKGVKFYVFCPVYAVLDGDRVNVRVTLPDGEVTFHFPVEKETPEG